MLVLRPGCEGRLRAKCFSSWLQASLRDAIWETFDAPGAEPARLPSLLRYAILFSQMGESGRGGSVPGQAEATESRGLPPPYVGGHWTITITITITITVTFF